MESTQAQKSRLPILCGVLGATRFWRLALLLLLGVVTYLALTPKPQAPLSLGWDKLNHLFAFTVLAAVGAMGFARAWTRLALGLLAFGVLIEILQSFTPHRSAEWRDLLADLLGIALGLAVACGTSRAAARLAQLR